MDQQRFAQAFAPRAIGETIYSPDGELYDQIPRSARNLSTKHLIFGAILELCSQTSETGATVQTNATDARDKDIEAKTGCHLRTIQRVLKALEDETVGLIRRIRGGGRRVIELAKKLRDKPPKPKAPAKPGASQPAEPAGAQEPAIDLEYGRWAVEFSEKHGWRLIINESGNLDKQPIEGRQPEELPVNFRDGIKMHLTSILAFLRGTHKRE